MVGVALADAPRLMARTSAQEDTSPAKRVISMSRIGRIQRGSVGAERVVIRRPSCGYPIVGGRREASFDSTPILWTDDLDGRRTCFLGPTSGLGGRGRSSFSFGLAFWYLSPPSSKQNNSCSTKHLQFHPLIPSQTNQPRPILPIPAITRSSINPVRPAQSLRTSLANYANGSPYRVRNFTASQTNPLAVPSQKLRKILSNHTLNHVPFHSLAPPTSRSAPPPASLQPPRARPGPTASRIGRPGHRPQLRSSPWFLDSPQTRYGFGIVRPATSDSTASFPLRTSVVLALVPRRFPDSDPKSNPHTFGSIDCHVASSSPVNRVPATLPITRRLRHVVLVLILIAHSRVVPAFNRALAALHSRAGQAPEAGSRLRSP